MIFGAFQLNMRANPDLFVNHISYIIDLAMQFWIHWHQLSTEKSLTTCEHAGLNS